MIFCELGTKIHDRRTVVYQKKGTQLRSFGNGRRIAFSGAGDQFLDQLSAYHHRVAGFGHHALFGNQKWISRISEIKMRHPFIPIFGETLQNGCGNDC